MQASSPFQRDDRQWGSVVVGGCSAATCCDVEALSHFRLTTVHRVSPTWLPFGLMQSYWRNQPCVAWR
eukprot:COSAG02_NODE_17867_length_975_cov_0.647260_2_plen_68_part_00